MSLPDWRPRYWRIRSIVKKDKNLSITIELWYHEIGWAMERETRRWDHYTDRKTVDSILRRWNNDIVEQLAKSPYIKYVNPDWLKAIPE